jgi:tetratricopeptide (TPR) repeat protein
MAHQLSLLDAARPAALPPAPAPRAAPPVTPGQQGLFGGPHVAEVEVDRALVAGDAAALRALADRIEARWPDHAPLAHWRHWADALDALSAGDADARLDAADRLVDPDWGLALFPDMGADRFAALYDAAVLRALHRGLESDADPTRFALRLCGLERFAEARPALETRVRAAPGDADAWTALARCRAAQGDTEVSLAAFARVALLAPERVGEPPDWPAELAACAAEAEDLELPGPPGAWVAALADLAALCPLPAPESLPGGDTPALRFTRDLAQLRALRRRRAPDAEAHPVKASLLAAAPALRERLRPV